MISTRPTSRPLRDSDVTELGTTKTGDRFVAWQGSEYVVHGSPLDPGAVANPPHPDQIRLAVDGYNEETRTSFVAQYLGEKVPAGTFQKVRAEEERTARIFAPKASRPVNPIRRLNLRLTTLDELLADLGKRGIEVVGRGEVRAPGGRLSDVELSVITSQARLVTARANGTEVPCEGQHKGKRPPPAEVMVLLDVALCRECAA